jgi:tRNA1(Val) A37 N6-methylase TrmN6
MDKTIVNPNTSTAPNTPNNSNEERHYCLENLYSSRNNLFALAGQLPKLRAGYDSDKDGDKGLDYLARLHRAVEKVQNEFTEIIHALNELEYDVSLIETAQKMSAAVRKFRWLSENHSYDKVCSALNAFAQSLPQESNINKVALGRLMNRVKMGYFPTDLAHVKRIKDAIVFPKTNINLLDPCCGCGLALQAFSDDENTATYGIELDRFRAEKAEMVLDRVGYGTFFRSRISNRTFHCVFLNPPYMSVLQQGGSQRAERSFLLDILRYLMLDGLLVYIIPFYRLDEPICRILAENFSNLQVYKFQESVFKKYKQIVVFGKLKERSSNENTVVNELLMLSLHPENIPEITELQTGTFTLPEKEISVKEFKGAEFNVNELAHQLSKSDSIKHIFDSSKLDTMHRNPLLPLKVGQIGLIGGSGLMNGLVECDTPHIIKGRVIKQKSSETTTDWKKGTDEIREVTSNRMVFSVLTPYGHKSLS